MGVKVSRQTKHKKETGERKEISLDDENNDNFSRCCRCCRFSPLMCTYRNKTLFSSENFLCVKMQKRKKSKIFLFFEFFLSKFFISDAHEPLTSTR